MNMDIEHSGWRGIDYGMGQTNVDKENGIRYGVIHQNEVLQAWADRSKPYYGKRTELVQCECGNECSLPDGAESDGAEWGDTIECPLCENDVEIELYDYCEPASFYVNGQGYQAESGSYGDIFITKSPYYTRARFCSPCAPGACCLADPCDDGEKAYCFGHDWFYDTETGKAPYPVYRVSDDSLVTELVTE
jgi:hypothetical protein